MNNNTVLWGYITFLVLGGLIGFFKGKSKVSLIMSCIFAAGLSLCAINVIPHQARVIDVLLILLLVVFGIRLAKTKKFMPGGVMLIGTLAVLLLRHLA